MVLRTLSLFSGIGGFDVALKNAGGFQTIGYTEIDPSCRQVLLDQMRDGRIDAAPIHHDVRGVDGKPYRGRAELLCGGFPCQDLSVAGLRAGIDGERSGLWREYARLVREIRPLLVLVENVPGLLVRGLGRVLGDLAESGYDAEWDCLPASAFGAPHRRDRVFIVAHSRSGWGQSDGLRPGGQILGSGSPPAPTDAERWGLQGGVFGPRNARAIQPPAHGRTSLGTLVGKTWQAEPQEDWLDDGIPGRLAEVFSRCWGNAVVPQVIEWIGKQIVKVAS